MNREIKFRAWDGVIMSNWNTLCQSAFNRSGEHSMLYLAFTDPTITLMQFTGYKDKNNKDIYEGDVVHHRLANGVLSHGEVSVRPNSGVMVGTRPIAFDIELLGNVYEDRGLLVNA